MGATHNARLMLMNRSGIYGGTADFKVTVVYAVYQSVLHGADPLVFLPWYNRLKRFSLYFEYFNTSLGLVEKPWSRTPIPGTGGYGVGDLIDWPPNARDQYVFNNVSTVPNSYVAKALDFLSEIAGWFNKTVDQTRFRNS